MPNQLPSFPVLLPQRIQLLPPAAAHFCLAVGRFISHSLHVSVAQSSLLVGFSGGADSTALLLALHYLAPQYGYSLAAAHLDHALRPSSYAEAMWCQNVCNQLGIPFYSKQMQWPNGVPQNGVEEQSRIARYEFFGKVQQKANATWLCLGHQLNDLAEDMLMRLGRGTGWPALGGMVGVCHTRHIIRPLLLTPRVTLEAFLQLLNVTGLEDESNASDSYLRNRVRNTLMPFMMQENPAFLDSVASLWQQAQVDREFFAEVVPPVNAHANTFASTEAAIAISYRDVVAHLPRAVRLRHYKQCAQQVGGQHIRMEQLFALDEAWFGQKFPKTILFSGSAKAIIKKTAIYWCTK